MSEKFICSHCGGTFSEDEMTYFDGEMYCEECLDELTVICECCGNRIFADDSADSDIVLCRYCYDEHYTTCEACGRTIHYDDACYFDGDDDYPYCYSCYNRRNASTYIHDYGYKPEPIFYGDGNRYFGVELEIDDGGHYDENADKISKAGNKDCTHIYAHIFI